jgi:hypothetical protein
LEPGAVGAENIVMIGWLKPRGLVCLKEDGGNLRVAYKERAINLHSKTNQIKEKR